MRLTHLTQLHNPSKSFPLLVENPRLLKNHWLVGSHEVEPSTLNLGGGNEDGAPGGILEIAYNFTASVSRIFGHHANDLDGMVEMVMIPPYQMANLARQRTNQYSLMRKRLKDRRASTRLVIHLRNIYRTSDQLRAERFWQPSENQTLHKPPGIPLFLPTAIGKIITLFLQQ